MADSLPTVWPASPHTLAKHRILGGYLKAWMPILARGFSRGSRQILFVDGFAGPGRYEGGEDGSPIIAIKAALEHSHTFPVPVGFLFVEKDAERYAELVRVIDDLKPRISASPNIRLLEPVCGDCDSVLREQLEECDRQNKPFGPALVFLDQFGYSAVPMDLIGLVMRHPSCEVFAYMNWSQLNPYLTDKNKWPAISRAFGDDGWKSCLDLPAGRGRDDRFLAAYSDRLRTAGNTRFIWSFAMCGEGDQLLYWLFFCTNSIRGLEEMKRAMWEVDDQGRFRFSDGANPDQLALFKGATQSWLADHLHKKFLGETRTVGELHEYALVHTPCFRYKEALAKLENEGRVRVTGSTKRKKGSFSDESWSLEFVKGHPVQQRLL